MNTLNPYSGPWNFQFASHLLRRTTFGPSKAQIETAISDGLEQTITKLFEDQSLPELPIYYDFENDPNAGIGDTWVEKPIPVPAIAGLNNARLRSLRSWTMGIMESSDSSIFGKMVLFWHEHLPSNNVNNPQFGHKYVDTLTRHALGNFKTLIEEITVDAQMLRFLNGHENSVQSPNENYARELLELFTIGRGPDAGSGDYTNYTEQDVQEMARALTGWRSNVDSDTGMVLSTFNPNRHDEGSKELSARFDNVIIENQGEEEYKAVIDIIFQKEEVAKFLCRKLHVWFVNADLSDEVELNIIGPLAEQLIDEDFEVEEVIKTLLLSEYFYQESLIGCMISHPIDFMFKATKTFEYVPTLDAIVKYDYWKRLHDFGDASGMSLLDVPTVAGWKAFYQSPIFYKIWINSVSLRLREFYSDIFVTGIMSGDFNLKIDLISFIAQGSDPLDPNVLINDITQVLFVHPVSQNQHDFLKELLIPGLPDSEWTIEYSEFLSDPNDPDKLMGIETKLKSMFGTMLKMPEFYLI